MSHRCWQEAQQQAVDHKHWHAPAMRGATHSPGKAALAAASSWLEVLTVALASLQLPAAGLALLSDITQLLFYHEPWDPAQSSSSELEQPAVLVCHPGHLHARPHSVLQMQHLEHRAAQHSLLQLPCRLSCRAPCLSEQALAVQDSMQAVVGVLGSAAVQKLWVHLLVVEEGSSETEDLAWLALLACWRAPSCQPIVWHISGSTCSFCSTTACKPAVVARALPAAMLHAVCVRAWLQTNSWPQS